MKETQLEVKKSGQMREFDISDELYREYDFGDRVYRINDPKVLILYFRTGPFTPRGFGQQGDCHRIVDIKGVVHCVPRPGIDGCVLRWQNRPGCEPCKF